MGELTMPRLSDTMSEGTIGRWLKKPGDTVEVGDIVAEIETDKATMELEAFEGGVLQKILVNEGQTVPIGEPIGIIGDGAAEESDAAPAAAPETKEASAQDAPAEAQAEATATLQAQEADRPEAAAEATAPDSGSNGRVKASPLARNKAEQMGIDLSKVKGTGPGGRILAENVDAFKQSGSAEAKQAPAPQPAAQQAPAQAPTPAKEAPRPAPAAAPAGDITPMSRMRRAISRAMNESKPGVPHIYVTVEIDMGAAMALRKQINDGGAGEVKVSVNDMVVKAAAKALLKFPAVNNSYVVGADGNPGILSNTQVNVSVAVALEDGLIAPVVRDTDKKSIGTISSEIRELAKRARDGKSKQQDLEGATFQVSNLGMYDAVEFMSIITVPQAASLAVGAVRKVPVVRDGEIVVGEVMNATLSVDHRVADGATAAQYLQELTRLLQNPMSLLV